MPEDFYYKSERYTLWDDGKLTRGKDGGQVIAHNIDNIKEAKNVIDELATATAKTGWGWGGRKTRGRKSRRRKPTRRRRR